MNNTYQVVTPVRGEDFFGRGEIIKGILNDDELSHCWVVGARRGGKTSLLKQLEYIVENSDEYQERYIPIIWNMEGLEDEKGLKDRLLESLFKSEKRRVGILGELGLNEPNEMALVDIFHQLSLSLGDSGKQLLLLCDEVDALIDISKNNEKLVSDLKNCFQSEWTRTVIASTGALSKIKQKDSGKKPFLYGFEPPQFILGKLSTHNAMGLIKKATKPLYDSVVNKWENEICARTNQMPFYIQLLCKKILESEFSESDDFDSILEDTYLDYDFDTILENDLNGFNDIEKKVLLSVIENSNIASSDIVELLSDYDLDKDGILKAVRRLHALAYIEEDGDKKYQVKNYFLNRWHSQNLHRFVDLNLIRKTSKTTYLNKDAKSALPVSIKQVRIENFNGIIKTEIEDIPADARWIFLTGENGFGKTSILQAIVIGLFGQKDGDTDLVGKKNKLDETKPVKIGVEYRRNGKDSYKNIDSSKNVDSLESAKIEDVFPFAAYGPSRLNIFKGSGDEENTNPTYNLFNSDGLLLGIETELKDLKKDSEKYKALKNVLLKLLEPYIADVKIEGQNVFYYERDVEDKKQYKPVGFNQLASGFRSLLATFGDMIIRLGKPSENILKSEEIAGIVIIDELDLHMHPKWQRRIVERLSELFPKIQFIASTHSILPILGAPEESIFIKVTRNKEQGITAKREYLDLKNLSPNIILSSPLFDTPLTTAQNKDKRLFRTDDDYDALEADKEVDKELKETAKEREARLGEILNGLLK